MFSRMRTLSLAALLAAALATPALAKPPWISIEYPVNPYDASLRGAFLVVHTFIHRTPVALPLAGTAEGIVNGERRTIPLEFTETAEPGVYVLNQRWPREGVWTLVIRAGQAPGMVATGVVEIGADGEIASVRVPTKPQGTGTIPTDVSIADIDKALRARAGALASRP
ncbi:MAG TPA: hypothetical protein VGQ25_08675 [Gemmatimonadales bacterium]|nr:hypothetical protein [Gemmatimonadales bacterium]